MNRDEEIRIMCLPKMQEKFQEAMGEPQWNDFLFYPETGSTHTCEAVLPEHTNFIRLPLPIDPVNPERGLWGMVDWHWFTMIVDGPDVHIFQWDAVEESYIWTSGYCNVTLALLKALAHQWGIDLEAEDGTS